MKEAIKDLFECLPLNQTLHSLKMRKCEFGANFTESLVQFLLSNSSLSSLDVGSAEFDVELLEKFCEALSRNKTLNCLSLSSCKCLGKHSPNKILKEIVKVVRVNDTLTELDLHDLEFNSQILRDLVESLKQNPTLRVLKMRGNCVNEKDSLHFFNALDDIPSLTEVEFPSWYYGPYECNSEVEKIKEKMEERKKRKRKTRTQQLVMLMIQRRSGTIVNKLPRRLLVHLLSFVE